MRFCDSILVTVSLHPVSLSVGKSLANQGFDCVDVHRCKCLLHCLRAHMHAFVVELMHRLVFSLGFPDWLAGMGGTLSVIGAVFSLFFPTLKRAQRQAILARYC